MKSLKSLNFGVNEVVQRKQMKSILGGTVDTEDDGNSGNVGCKSGIMCADNSDCDDNGDTACFCGTSGQCGSN